MDSLVVLVMVGVYGVGALFAVTRAARERRLRGLLPRPDAAALPLRADRGAGAGYATHVERMHLAARGAWITRVRIDGCQAASELGFRLSARTKPRTGSLAGRLVVDGTGSRALAERLFEAPDVREALALLCGAHASFREANLYPAGSFIIDVEDGDADDVVERALRFLETVDRTLPTLPRDAPQLGAASGAGGSPATFSIDLR